MLYLLMFDCRGGGWYVMCAKSVAVRCVAAWALETLSLRLLPGLTQLGI